MMANSSLWSVRDVDTASVDGKSRNLSDKLKNLRESLGSAYINCKEPKNVVVVHEERLLVWHPDDSSIYCLSSKGKTSVSGINVIVPSSPPLFEVDNLLITASGRYCILSGLRGVKVVELPRNWTMHCDKETITCKSWTLAERLFVCNKRLNLVDIAWHPGSESDKHVVLLTNDNYLRIFDVTDSQVPLVYVKLNDGGDGSRSSFACPLGDSVLSFDFGPPVAKMSSISQDESISDQLPKQNCYWPIYMLCGNGDVLLFNHMLSKNECIQSKLVGPLRMLPAAEDNYGSDACKLVCLDSSPPIIVIATSTGMIYHCIVIGGADSEDDAYHQDSNSFKPTLYVCESVELALSLVAADEPESSSPIRLYKDPISVDRYFLTHGAGLHAVHMPLVNQLSSSNISSSEPCIVEHLVCTKALASSTMRPNDWSPPLGLTINWRNASTCLNLILNNGDLLTQSLAPVISNTFLTSPLTAGRDQASVTEKRDNSNQVELAEHIKQILKRSVNIPSLLSKKDLKANGDELLQLVLNITEILRQEYLQKQDIAAKALEKRVKALSNEKSVQFEEFTRCSCDKEALIEGIKSLSMKYDASLQKQKNLSDRLEKVLDKLHNTKSELSDAEKNMSDELEFTKKKLDDYHDKMSQVESKYYYQKDLISGDAATPKSKLFNGTAKGQISNIKTVLANE